MSGGAGNGHDIGHDRMTAGMTAGKAAGEAAGMTGLHGKGTRDSDTDAAVKAYSNVPASGVSSKHAEFAARACGHAWW